MSERRYILASNKVPKLDCPYCGAKRHWQRYIDTHTGEALPDEHGKCDNSDKCGEWVTPKATGYAQEVWRSEASGRIQYRAPRPKTSRPAPDPMYFEPDTFKKTLEPVRYEKNVFLLNLMHRGKYPLLHTEVLEVARMYCLGTVAEGTREGAVTFPYIDFAGRVRAVQVKQFDENNHTKGHADKLDKVLLRQYQQDKEPVPDWLTKYIEYGEAKGYYNCLFGEHLLPMYPGKPVALVEAPKTAIYGALYFTKSRVPYLRDCVWLAVGAKDYLNFERVTALAGRTVFVFPDLSDEGKTFKEWEGKLKEYAKRLHGTRFVFPDLIEKYASPEQRKAGADIADILANINWRDLRPAHNAPREQEAIISKPAAPVQKIPLPPPVARPEPILQNWNKEIEELEIFFSEFSPPAIPIKLNGCTMVTNVQGFVLTHLSTAKHNNGNRRFLPYLERLQEFKKAVTNTIN
jgi:hypothetical protein